MGPLSALFSITSHTKVKLKLCKGRHHFFEWSHIYVCLCVFHPIQLEASYKHYQLIQHSTLTRMLLRLYLCMDSYLLRFEGEDLFSHWSGIVLGAVYVDEIHWMMAGVKLS